MSEEQSPYFMTEKNPINKAHAMINDYLTGLKTEFGNLSRAVHDLEVENKQLREENGDFLDKLHEKDLEIKDLRILEAAVERLKRAGEDEAVFGDHNLVPSLQAEVERLRGLLRKILADDDQVELLADETTQEIKRALALKEAPNAGK